MSDAYSGGCACGAIRYEVSGEPVAENHCQCRQCQRQTGGGRASCLTFVGADVKVQGEPAQWEVIGDLGTVKQAAFCRNCGSPLYLKFPAMPDVVVVRAGSLDNPQRYQPKMVFWTAAAQPWDHLESGLTEFEKMPPSQAAG